MNLSIRLCSALCHAHKYKPLSPSTFTFLGIHVLRVLVPNHPVNLLLLLILRRPHPVLRRRDAPRRHPQEEVALEVVDLVVEAMESVVRITS